MTQRRMKTCKYGDAVEYQWSPSPLGILLLKSIPPWAFCLTVGVEQGQDLFGDVRILSTC